MPKRTVFKISRRELSLVVSVGVHILLVGCGVYINRYHFCCITVVCVHSKLYRVEPVRFYETSYSIVDTFCIHPCSSRLFPKGGWGTCDP